MKTWLLAAAAAMVVCGPWSSVAEAQTKLKFAHVYETNEPYHVWAVWAGQEIQKRTGNRYSMEVFPASSLGNEPTINQGLALGTVDIIYTGTSFAGTSSKPLVISGAPFMLRDFAHWKAYRDSDLFKELAAGYDKATGHRMVALTYYGERMVTSNKPIMTPADMNGLKLRVPQAPLYIMFAKSVGANATPIAFAEVYLALQQGTVDAQENPLPTIQAKKFHEVQKFVNLTSHITESLVTIIGAPLWGKLSAADRQAFEAIFKEAAAKATDEIRESEQKLPAWFEQQGKTVTRPDRAAFRAAAVKLHLDASAGAGWTKEQYDRLQGLGAKTN